MRVIAGTYRSRPLLAPRGSLTRPTSDRLRETLFNILQPRIHGARFADLYAGTGAVGIEALSRGAAYVLFAERADPALTTIRANLKALGITSGFSIEPRSAIAAIDHAIDHAINRLAPSAGSAPASLAPAFLAPASLAPASLAFDILFLDPPYEAAADYTNILALLGSNRAQPLLAPDALIIAEHSSRLPLPDRFGSLHQTRTRRQGATALTFYQGSLHQTSKIVR